MTMKKESTINFSEHYQKLTSSGGTKCAENTKRNLLLPLSFFVMLVLIIQSVIFIWCLKIEVNELQIKIELMEAVAEERSQIFKNLQNLISIELKNIDSWRNFEDKSITLRREGTNSLENDNLLNDTEQMNNTKEKYDSDEDDNDVDNDYDDDDNDDDDDDDHDHDDDNANFVFKRKREIRDYNESSIEKDTKPSPKDKNESKLDQSFEKKYSSEMSSLEKSIEMKMETPLKEKIFHSSHNHLVSSTRKPHTHRKHRKSRIGSAERFFTETHSTTTTPIQVRQSRTKPTQMHIDKSIWLQNQKFQQHTSPHRDTITKEEAMRKGFGKHLEDVSYSLESSSEHASDSLTYNMIMIHFSADTSHYSRERDPHYFGNGRMQIKSDVYKDWKPAHWTQGVGMSKYFHLHQGRVTVSTTGIYLIYAQIQYSNIQEVNGFSVFRNNEVVVQCITTSTHPDKHEIKSNTCGISTTILLQSNDSVFIKDLHHGRYVVLTPEKSYFGLVLLSPFKN